MKLGKESTEADMVEAHSQNEHGTVTAEDLAPEDWIRATELHPGANRRITKHNYTIQTSELIDFCKLLITFCELAVSHLN